MTTRAERKAALKEDIKHVLEELWDTEEEEPLYKTFTRECLGAKRIQDVLQCSKADIQDLSCRDDEDSVLFLQNHETEKFRMMVHYQSHSRAKELSPEDTCTFRFNTITRKEYVSFVRHADDIALVSSICDMTTTPPANTVLADNFKVTYSPANSFKKYIKIDTIIFTTFKEGKNGTLSAGTPLPLLEHRKYPKC